jgi:YHS domain-containing protein
MMKTMNMKIGMGLLLWAGLLGGCASGPTTPATGSATAGAPVMASSKAPHAECLVCKYNADLACVDLKVDAETPNSTYDGKTYYFCSDTCRKKFEKDPAKYIRQK